MELGELRWEVIVIDNGSSDATPDVLSKHAESLPIVSLVEPLPGKNRALNLGLQSARGELLVFTDDDIIPDRRWLSALHAASNRWPDVAVFGGPIIPTFPAGTPEWVADPSFSYAAQAFGRFDPQMKEGYIEHTPYGANLAIRSHVFESLRYNESVGPAGGNYIQGSELELLLRLKEQGERFVFVPAASVEHVITAEQVTLPWLFNRAFRYGRGMAHFKRSTQTDGLLFGAPRTMWWNLLESWVRHVLSVFRSGPARFRAGERFYYMWGRLSEHRRLAERAAGDERC